MNRTRLLDVTFLRDFIKTSVLKDYALHSEVFLNLFVSILVIAFISYQAVSLLSKTNRRPERRKDDQINKKETSDRGSGEDSLLTDLHEFIFQQKEIPYHIPVVDDEETLKISQIYYEHMKCRRSVRTFSSRTVPMKVIQNLIKAAGTAPSVGNAQPWIFCVIVRDDIKQEIRDILETEERENTAKRTGVEWVVDVSTLEQAWSRPYITDAPCLIAVCHKIFKEVNGEQKRLFYYNELSTSIAVGVLLTAIQNVGLGTVVTSPMNSSNRIAQVLRRPDNESLLLLLPLGYPADDTVVPDLKRKPVESIIKLY